MSPLFDRETALKSMRLRTFEKRAVAAMSGGRPGENPNQAARTAPIVPGGAPGSSQAHDFTGAGATSANSLFSVNRIVPKRPPMGRTSMAASGLGTAVPQASAPSTRMSVKDVSSRTGMPKPPSMPKIKQAQLRKKIMGGLKDFGARIFKREKPGPGTVKSPEPTVYTPPPKSAPTSEYIPPGLYPTTDLGASIARPKSTVVKPTKPLSTPTQPPTPRSTPAPKGPSNFEKNMDAILGALNSGTAEVAKKPAKKPYLPKRLADFRRDAFREGSDVYDTYRGLGTRIGYKLSKPAAAGAAAGGLATYMLPNVQYVKGEGGKIKFNEQGRPILEGIKSPPSLARYGRNMATGAALATPMAGFGVSSLIPFIGTPAVNALLPRASRGDLASSPVRAGDMVDFYLNPDRIFGNPAVTDAATKLTPEERGRAVGESLRKLRSKQ